VQNCFFSFAGKEEYRFFFSEMKDGLKNEQKTLFL